MKSYSKIYIAGHTGLVGSALTNTLRDKGYTNLLLRTMEELDLTDQKAVDAFFAEQKPEYVFIAAAKVGGIVANNTLRADFIYVNLMIQSNMIYSAWKHGVKKLLFLGSTCIYPKKAPQPMKEDIFLPRSWSLLMNLMRLPKLPDLRCANRSISSTTRISSL